jgi:hypothetical protein
MVQLKLCSRGENENSLKNCWENSKFYCITFILLEMMFALNLIHNIDIFFEWFGWKNYDWNEYACILVTIFEDLHQNITSNSDPIRNTIFKSYLNMFNLGWNLQSFSVSFQSYRKMINPWSWINPLQSLAKLCVAISFQ